MLTCRRYEMPTSLAEALTLYRDAPAGSRLIAGATDILPWAREGRAGDVEIDTLIDVTRVAELNGYAVDGDRIRLGANTTWQHLLEDQTLVRLLPCMPYASIWFADDQIREQATLAGNLVNASPAADGTPPVLAMDGEVEIAGLDNGEVWRRIVPVAEFVTGPGDTGLGQKEIVTAVILKSCEGYGGSFQKVGQRRSLVISAACVAGLVKTDPAGEIFEDVRLALGGVGPVPLRLWEVEDRLRGKPVSSELIAEAAEGTDSLVASRSRVAYRRHVVPGFIRATVEEALARCAAALTSPILK